MTTLPPLPKEFVCANGLWTYYTADQMKTYATEACASLEAEVARLREALAACYPIVQHEKFMQDASYGKNFSKGKAERARKAYELTRTALEGKQ